MSRPFDLVDRTIAFSKDVIRLSQSISRSVDHIDIVRQLIRSSTSVGANYVEANDALGKRDFIMKIKTARREANEAKYWLQIITCDETDDEARITLVDEADQLARILSAIAAKVEKSQT